MKREHEASRQTAAEKARRKRITRYLDSPKQPQAFTTLRDAIYDAAPRLDATDEARIAENLFTRRMFDYDGPRSRAVYLEWASGLVRRLAKLTARAKDILPNLREAASTVPDASHETGYGDVAQMIVGHLDEYEGADDDFGAFDSWAVQWTIRACEHTILFCKWYDDPACQSAVRDGVMSVLRSCRDLGAVNDEGSFTIVKRQLCRDSWHDIFANVDELAHHSPVPIEYRLKGRARFTARAWKSRQLSDKDTFITDGDYVKLENLAMLPDENAFTTSILTHKDAAHKPTTVRQCGTCNATLARWNQSNPPICRPCWEAVEYGEPEPTDATSELQVA